MTEPRTFNYLTDKPQTEREREVHALTRHLRPHVICRVADVLDRAGYQPPPAPPCFSEEQRARAAQFVGLQERAPAMPTEDLLALWKIADIGPTPLAADRLTRCFDGIADAAGARHSAEWWGVAGGIRAVADEVQRRAKAGDPEITRLTDLEFRHVVDGSRVVILYGEIPAGHELRRRLSADDCPLLASRGPTVLLGSACLRVFMEGDAFTERFVAPDWFATGDIVRANQAARREQLGRSESEAEIAQLRQRLAALGAK